MTNDPLSVGLGTLRYANVTRRDEWHQGASPWTGADWSNEMCGEAGEAANVVKKLRRIETDVVQRGPRSTDELRKALGSELADVIIVADLLAAHYDLSNLGGLVVAKFNATSDKHGLSVHL